MCYETWIHKVGQIVSKAKIVRKKSKSHSSTLKGLLHQDLLQSNKSTDSKLGMVAHT